MIRGVDSRQVLFINEHLPTYLSTYLRNSTVVTLFFDIRTSTSL